MMSKRQKLGSPDHRSPIKAQFSIGVIVTSSFPHSSLITVLFGRGKNGGCVVGNANGDAAIVGEPGEPLDACEVKAQSGGSYLHSEASFRLRFCAQWAIAGPGIGTAINFTGEAKLVIQAEDSRRTVGDHVVLRKQLRRRGQDGNANIAESVEPSIVTKLLAN